ncbi:MAG TPA: hypothetical protein PKH33_15575 [bacterium]|nr:hypothetical protein [bacterium]
MKKGLMVIFADINAGVVKSQAIVHAREMLEMNIVDFEIWCFAFTKSSFEQSLLSKNNMQELCGSKIRLFKSVKPAFPLSILINAIILFFQIKKASFKFDIVHARGEFATAVCAYIKPFFRFKLIRDSRGDSITEYLYRRYPVLEPASKAYHSIFMWYRIAAMRYAALISNAFGDKSLFVTKELKNRIGNRFQNNPCWIIPSLASDSLFYFNESLRCNKRNELGYSESDKVVVYSGILKIYRVFPEYVEVFKRLYDSDNSFKFLILTPDMKYAESMLKDLPENAWRVLSSSFDDVNAYLNAADFAMMILERNPSNFVSSPVKFAEYSLVGLPVIMSDSVPSSYEIAKNIGNLCEYKNGEIRFMQVYDRQAVANKYKEVLSKSAYLNMYKEIYGN